MSEFIKTEVQREAIKLLSGPQKHTLLYGGSRSGKSAIICYALVVRASRVKSRHLACRLNFAHARSSLWNETFPTIFNMCFPDLPIKQDKSQFIYHFPNGSEIQIAGLDDKQRVEKISLIIFTL